MKKKEASKIYNFDMIPERRNTKSLKYDFAMERKKRDDLIPMWVADMDFPLPEEILQDIRKRADHGIFGYTEVDEEYGRVVEDWFLGQYNWKIQKNQITVTPGVVFAIAQAICAFSKEQDGILIQKPVYYPFEKCIELNHRKVVNNQLIYSEGTYQIDFEDFERKIKENKVQIFILCNPHNPVGRVWTEEELEKLGRICDRYQVIVISDEIHCDFVYSGHTFHPFASTGKFAEHAIICTAPTKTFNIAGLQISNIIIQDEKIRNKFRTQVAASGYSQANTFGLTACEAAYRHGKEWLIQVRNYIEENFRYADNFLQEKIPEIKAVRSEGTYLLWMDCSQLGISGRELEDLITDRAGLWLDSGRIFSEESELFQRMNLACPRSTLQKALEQLEKAVRKIRKKETDYGRN